MLIVFDYKRGLELDLRLKSLYDMLRYKATNLLVCRSYLSSSNTYQHEDGDHNCIYIFTSFLQITGLFIDCSILSQD